LNASQQSASLSFAARLLFVLGRLALRFMGILHLLRRRSGVFVPVLVTRESATV
jgi:hypothetical protein